MIFLNFYLTSDENFVVVLELAHLKLWIEMTSLSSSPWNFPYPRKKDRISNSYDVLSTTWNVPFSENRYSTKSKNRVAAWVQIFRPQHKNFENIQRWKWDGKFFPFCIKYAIFCQQFMQFAKPSTVKCRIVWIVVFYMNSRLLIN